MSPIDPTQLLQDSDLVFVDVETTGLYPVFGDRVVELGALKVRDGREIDSFSRLVDPQRPISPGASAVNGITNEMVRGEPVFSEVADSFLSFIEGAILIAHNAPFDLGFLSSELHRAGFPMLRNQIVDTLQISRRYFQFGSNSLGSLARGFGVATPDAHRALGDCRTTFQVFQCLLDELFGDETPTVGMFLDRAIGWHVEGDEADPLNLLPPSLRGPVKRREPIVIDYIDARGVMSTRKILLKEVTAMRDYVYLVAYCYARQAERTFRLDRIVRWEKH